MAGSRMRARHGCSLLVQPIDDLPHLADQEYTMVARTRLVRTVMTGLDERFPAMRDYGIEQRERTAEDVARIVDFLATALYIGDAELFTGFLSWTAEILTARGVRAHALIPALDILSEELKDFPRALSILEQAADRLTGTRSVIASDSGTAA
ncbi:hypothetical protein ACFYPT_41310 [Streptomyces sp. NPDC005529]|uniref:hypothetical protein n=1 Tax=unclassified Streptomyces TaxID=2593676 RepID=UPI0036C84B9D